MRVLVSAALVLAGCAVEVPPPLPLPVGDPALFVSSVQPVLDQRCAAACHADPIRPFAFYSAGLYRADPARLHLIEPLTADELDANARAVAGFALDALVAGEPLASCPVVCKPLDVAAGGCGHVVGPVFAGRDERDYQALRAYLETLQLPEEP